VRFSPSFLSPFPQPRSYTENFRQIHERVSDRLLDMSAEYEQMQLNFHLTSVYDHSLHEAFSRVLHKLIQSLPFLEELLNVFCAVSFEASFGVLVLILHSRTFNRRKHFCSTPARDYTSLPTPHL
jgi:hypothetical protein